MKFIYIYGCKHHNWSLYYRYDDKPHKCFYFSKKTNYVCHYVITLGRPVGLSGSAGSTLQMVLSREDSTVKAVTLSLVRGLPATSTPYTGSTAPRSTCTNWFLSLIRGAQLPAIWHDDKNIVHSIYRGINRTLLQAYIVMPSLINVTNYQYFSWLEDTYSN